MISNYIKLEDININDVRIKIVRDDIYPFVGGGNKARKAVYYEKYMLENGYNAIVTTGGIQSNHNRAMALIAAKNNWKCHLVYHGEKERFKTENGNAKLIRLTKATCEFVEANQISDAMDNAMLKFQEDGFKPLYVTGGGHDIPGGIAFVDAIKLLKSECEEIDYIPDYIVLASGTGSTQAGLMAGLDNIGWDNTKVIGISVARQKERGIFKISEFYKQLLAYLNLTNNGQEINFFDEYVFGGYEKYTPEMEFCIKRIIENSGIIFDTTYSGKALYGMMDLIKNNTIGGNVLFWHTGGIMNVLK